MKQMRIAIPSVGQGGLDGTRAGHFGHCDVFTIIDSVDGEIQAVTTVQNVDHSQGGCMVPVNLLVSHKVNALLVGGIGIRPLMGFRQAGITVFHEAETAAIRPAVLALIAGDIPEIQENQVCGAH